MHEQPNLELQEKNKDGSKKFSNVKPPKTTRSWINASVTLEKCKKKCTEIVPVRLMQIQTSGEKVVIAPFGTVIC